MCLTAGFLRGIPEMDFQRRNSVCSLIKSSETAPCISKNWRKFKVCIADQKSRYNLLQWSKCFPLRKSCTDSEASTSAMQTTSAHPDASRRYPSTLTRQLLAVCSSPRLNFSPFPTYMSQVSSQGHCLSLSLLYTRYILCPPLSKILKKKKMLAIHSMDAFNNRKCGKKKYY